MTMQKSAKKSRPTNHLPTVAESLTFTAERMLDLASKISDTGKPMTDEERELVQLARLPILTQIFHDLKVQYITTNYMDTYELNRFKEEI